METNANQKVSCVANYVYDASEADELSLRVGDVLQDVERLPGGWWRGELRGRRGMFPDNFVSVVDHVNNRSGGVQGRCRAVFSYQPANPDELPLSVGDVLDVLAEVEEGWWQGRRGGRVGVFPSNFVVMLDPAPATAAVQSEPAPALPPKPVKELCRVLFPYSAANDDELSLSEGDIVTVLSKEAPDRGWWRGELNGRQGLFPDNFVQLLPAVSHDVTEEKKPERPPGKTNLYPSLNKYTEKTCSTKELSTSKISLHKENTVSKESSIQSTVTHTNKSESEKIVHSESVTDGVDGQIKKPPVPTKKSPTPSSGVTGLFSGLKSKMLSSSDKDKSSTVSSSASNSSGEWDRSEPRDKPDGGAASRQPRASTFDHVERHSMLNDPRAGRVKAPRRRPPSQAFRDDTPQQIGLSNGHEVPTEKPKSPQPPTTENSEKAEEIKPKAREWEKHRAPWMAELKLNQAKKTSLVSETGKSRSVSSSDGMGPKSNSGSTERILECGLEEKRSTHSVEMSKSTSSIAGRVALRESFDELNKETKVRHSLDSKKESAAPREAEAAPRTVPANNAHSPTAAGRTFTTMLDDMKKQPAPAASIRTNTAELNDKTATKVERISSTTTEKYMEIKTSSGTVTSEKTVEGKLDKQSNVVGKENSVGGREKGVGAREKSVERSVSSVGGTLERRHNAKSPARDKSEALEELVTQLSNRILNLEKLLEVQNAKFNATIEELNSKLALEVENRQALQSEVEKLAHCVTQV